MGSQEFSGDLARKWWWKWWWWWYGSTGGEDESDRDECMRENEKKEKKGKEWADQSDKEMSENEWWGRVLGEARGN